MADKSSLPENRLIQKQLNLISKHTVPFIGWIWLFIFIVLLLALVIWSFLGTIDVNIEGKGLVLNKSGLFNIQTPVKGIAKAILVKPGDQVKKGELLAEIYDAEKEIELQSTMIKVDNLDREVKRLSHEIEVETEASTVAEEKKLESLEFDVKILHDQLQFLQREYKKKLKLFQKGLIIRNVVQESERAMLNVEIELEQKKGEIADVRSQLKKTYRTEELKSKKLELLKAQEDAAVVQASLKEHNIHSPHDGKILEVLVNPGEVVAEGQPLFNAEFLNSQKKFIFLGFFPSELGKHIHKGGVMRMALSTVNEYEYGAILSKVQRVSEYAISESAILNQIHNADLAAYLSNHIPVTEIVAEPILDPQDPSGFAWSSGKGPAIELSPGIVGTVEATIESIHPIYYLIPIKGFKKEAL